MAAPTWPSATDPARPGRRGGPGGPPAPAALAVAALALALALTAAPALAAAQTSKFGDYHLTQERIVPGLWRLQISLEPPDPLDPWPVSPMLTDPGTWRSLPPAEVTARLVVAPSPADDGGPRLIVYESAPGRDEEVAFEISAHAPDGQLAGLNFHGERYTHVVGLGADFRFDAVNVNHLGHVVMPGGPSGNLLERGMVERTSGIQAPACYALGPGKTNAAIFVNETRPLMWDFTSTPWSVAPAGPLGPRQSVDFFVILGPDLPSLRRTLMALIGRPPIPPKSVFGTWILAGERPAGQSWEDYFASLAVLKGVSSSVTARLPGQAERPPLAEAAAAGVGLLVAESPYLDADSPFLSDLDKRGFLVRQGGPRGPSLRLSYQGRPSYLIDYTNPAAASYWHSLGRSGLLNQGARLFYLDGGEPETYSVKAWYAGVSDPTVHSQYAWGQRFSLKWMEGIELGMGNQIFGPDGPPRIFLLARGGLGGLGRHGAGLLIDEPNLFIPQGAAQARSHLSMSGIDYYSTDISTFLAQAPLERGTLLYEAWLAKNVMFNLPLILPRRLMSEPWAQFSVAVKAKLEPYLYSLAHQAWAAGDPIVAPLYYHFQDDPLVRTSAIETMLGPWILVAAGVVPGAERLEFILPAGRWFDFYGREVVEQEETGRRALPSKFQGMHVSPLLLRSGAVIPTVWDPADPDAMTHVLGFPAEGPTSFLWYEDDGVSRAHRRGQYTTTSLELSPATAASPLTLTIRARVSGSPNPVETKGAGQRAFMVELLGVGNVAVALLDGQEYSRAAREEQLHELDSGYVSTGNGRLLFKTPPLDPTKDHVIAVIN